MTTLCKPSAFFYVWVPTFGTDIQDGNGQFCHCGVASGRTAEIYKTMDF